MRTHSKTPLFLIELVCMLLFFSISAVICLQIFAEAKEVAEESSRMDHALLEGQKAAEYWKETKGNFTEVAEKMGGKAEESLLQVFYDDAWNPQQEEGAFTLTLSAEGSKADICIRDGEEEIYAFLCEAVMYGE